MMTSKGEDVTQEGVITDHPFHLKKEIAISFTENSTGLNYVNDTFSQEELNLQLIFVLKGKVTYLLDDAKKTVLMLEDQQHNILLKQPQLQLQSSGELQDVVFLDISFAFLSRYLPNNHAGFLNLQKGLKQQKATVFSKVNLHLTPEINAILHALKTTTHTGFCAKLFLEAKVLELLMLQLSQFEQLGAGEALHQLKKEELEKMHTVRDILINNPNQQLSLRSLAHLAGTNEFTLKRNFKAAFGNTVYGYLTQHKMEQAKSMLIENEMTIAEVALKSGYKYATHFSNAFKKHFGYLPNSIRSGKLSVLIFIENFSLIQENLCFLP